MSELVESEIGAIAADWKVVPLEVVCEPPQYGFTASAAENGNVRFLRITDITDSGVSWSKVPFCDCPAVNAGAKLHQQAGVKMHHCKGCVVG